MLGVNGEAGELAGRVVVGRVRRLVQVLVAEDVVASARVLVAGVERKKVRVREGNPTFTETNALRNVQ